MNLLIIGQSVEDHIHRYDTVTVQPGGVFYSTAALTSIKKESDIISLHTSIEKDNYHLFRDYYHNAECVHCAEVERIPKVHLRFEPGRERCEHYENITDRLPMNFSDVNRYDGIYINMITGFDMRLEDLEKLRKDYPGDIYIDIHTLSRGLDGQNRRYFRKIPQIERWAAAVDFLQCNEHELRMTGDGEDELQLAGNILEQGPQYLLVTKGDSGATLYYKENGILLGVSYKAGKYQSVNNVGCGDVFGSVFFYFYMQNKNVCTALQYAAEAAGKVTEYASTDQIKEIKNVFSQIS